MQVNELLRVADTDGDGKLNFVEFSTFLQSAGANILHAQWLPIYYVLVIALESMSQTPVYYL